MRKICVVTGTRAEYGLLYHLIKSIDADKDLHLQLIVTGSHLEKEFGYTVDEITKDFNIDITIPLDLNDDSTLGIAKSMALAQVGFVEAYEILQPDIIILLGDRFEIFCAASSALISKIPVAHLHGGELTQGAYDDAFRHAITKMSHLHFTATKEYQNRVIQMGENPDMVFCVGGLGIENIKKLSLLSKEDFEQSLGRKLQKKNILVTYHPETLSSDLSQEQFQEILRALDTLENTLIIFTKANSDSDGKIINSMIDTYVKNNKEKSICFYSLGQVRYLSALQYVDCVVGNSSSGILEVPSFKIGTINIGDRQKGRIQAKSIINCSCKKEDIIHAFNIINSQEFKKQLSTIINPYEQKGNVIDNIISVIKTINFKNILKKDFYDLKRSKYE